MADEIIKDVVAVDAPEEKTADTAVLEEMAKAGLLFGRKRSRTNPRMKKYIYTTRNGFEIIDLMQTIEKIEAAQKFLKEVVKTGRPILFAGTTPASSTVTKEVAERLNQPFVAERWLGGTLTNFETISKRLGYYMTLKADQAAGRLDKYTKKERTAMEKEITRLTRLFGGLERLSALPAVVIVVGADSHEIATREANRMKIPVIAITNTTANPDMIQYVIPANDNSKSSIAYVLAKLEEAISQGVKERAAATAATTAKPSLDIKK